MSRADGPSADLVVDGDVPPPALRLGGAVRAAISDYYFNSLRLVALNIVWGLGLIGVLLVSIAWPLGALLLAMLMTLPAVGIFRVAALIARRSPVTLGDGFSAWRRYLLPALVAGVVLVLMAFVLVIDLVWGLGTQSLLGVAMATLSGWAMVGVVAVALCFWPLLVDPDRDGRGVRAATRLAALLVIAQPLRIGGLVLLIAIILVLSTIAFAALITISMSLCALIACHHVLPAADRLEARLGRSPAR